MHPGLLLTVTMLARVCVSEAGWDGYEECEVIVHAISQQAIERNIPLRRQICAYAPNSCNPDRTDSRRWIAHLNPRSRARPSGWPRLPWEIHRVRFVAMWMTAWMALTGRSTNPCPDALHWGSQTCSRCFERMRESNFVRAGCGLANVWFRRR